jgi:hypothetical protein
MCICRSSTSSVIGAQLGSETHRWKPLSRRLVPYLDNLLLQGTVHVHRAVIGF